MFDNKVDMDKNRLYVTIKGKMSNDAIKIAGEDVIEKARLLKPGFGVISDISEFTPLDEEGRLFLQTVMKTVNEGGMGHVIRVVKEDGIYPITTNQWQRTSLQAGYSADTVPTLQDAEKKLDELEKN